VSGTAAFRTEVDESIVSATELLGSIEGEGDGMAVRSATAEVEGEAEEVLLGQLQKFREYEKLG
jgi:hypothetical protein